MTSKSHCKLAYDDEIDGDEYETFYDFSATYEDTNDEEIELDEDGNVIEKEMQVTELGELKLPGGRIVGHRDFRVYYKQYHRAQETRPNILAAQREELLRLGYKYQAWSKISAEEIIAMPDSDVMAQLVKYHKEIRRGQIVEQRGKMRDEQRAQKNFMKSNANKLRSCEQTTQIIRDYHGSLM